MTARFACCAFETVDPAVLRTWTIGRTELAGGWLVVTSFNLAPFRRLPHPHHFETLVVRRGELGDTTTYQTEAEARDGHAVAVSRLRTQLEATA